VATKRTKKRHSRTSAPETPETAEHMIDRVLGAFDRWLAEREPNPQQFGETADIVRMACELKSSYLGEPNPADWNPVTAAEVVGQVIPRKVVGVDDRYIATLVPAMLTYIDFLVVTGRWKSHNDADATRAALSGLGDDLPRRFNDPGRLSMAGRLMQLAVDEGIDITEAGAIDGFMQRYNDMPYEWRKRLTDGPGMLPHLPDNLRSDDPWLWDEESDNEESDNEEVGGVGAFGAEDILADLRATIDAGIAAIGFDVDKPLRITVPDARSELAALLRTPLLTRILALAEWTRPGRKVTSTGAMRRGDTAEWGRRFGVATTEGAAPNSMWDWPELAAPWSVAEAIGMIDISSTTARPGPNSDIFSATDLSVQILGARGAVDSLLDGLIYAGSDLPWIDDTVVGLLLAVLASLCRPDGADLSLLRSLARPMHDNKSGHLPEELSVDVPEDLSEAISRIAFTLVLNIVDQLDEWGFVSTADGRTYVPPALCPAVVQAIDDPDSPFSITLKPGAVPLEAPGEDSPGDTLL